tara:strand:+ start:218 stop:559 length:342 start_codon:yes stop_codon:yes gene_type:complete
MAYQDNSTSYAFGQMGSILVTGTAAVSSNGVAGMEKAAFVAITFVEDTVFASDGLTAVDNAMYPNDNTAATGISASGGANTDATTFPAGMTIYGRWTALKLSAVGSVIAYVGY